MHLRRRPLAGLGAACALALALTGCSGGDPEPKMAPTQSVASTPSGEPSDELSLDAVETVRAWVEARNRALADGDTTEVEALTLRHCKSCYGLIDPIREAYEAGGYFRTDGWRVVRATEDAISENRSRVNAAVSIAGGETLTAAGEEPVTYGPDKRIVVFKLSRSGGAWFVSFTGFLS
mgnify:CR=1 FL=1